MYRGLRFPSAALLLALFSILLAAPRSAAQDSKVMGELKFKGASGVEKDAGVWVDGVYVGYVKGLKGDKKVLLLQASMKSPCASQGMETSAAKWSSNRDRFTRC